MMQYGDISRESELQNLLTDERSRCNQYKQIYQALKEEHSSAKEELKIIHHQLKEAVKQNNLVKSSKESYIKKLEESVLEKQEEIKAQKQQLSKLNPEDVRRATQLEERTIYEEKLNDLQAEYDKIQEKFNTSHYDNNILITRLEFSGKEHSRVIDLLNAQHTTEINHLKLQLEHLENNKEVQPVKDYSIELKDAQKEILQLTSRLKELHAECDELRVQNENLTIEKENNTQCNSQQLYEKIATIRALESEKEILNMQKQMFQTEISNVQKDKSSLKEELQSYKQENLSVKNELDSCRRNYEVANTNLKIESQHELAELESRNEKFRNQIHMLDSELAQVKLDRENDQKAFTLKEDNFQKSMLLVRQHHYKKLSDLEQVKDSIESKLKDAENARREDSTRFKLKLEEVSKELQLISKEKIELEKDGMTLRSKLETSSHSNESKHFESLMNQNSELHKEIHSLKEKITDILSHHVVLLPERGPSKESVGFNNHTDCQVKSATFEELSQLRLTLEQQKYQYQQRIDSVESHFREQQNIWLNEKKDMNAKIKQYGRLIAKLRDRLDSQKLSMEEMEVQNEILKSNVPVEEHLQLKKRLQELQQKQEEFHQVMIAALPFDEPPCHDINQSLPKRKLPFTLNLDQEHNTNMQVLNEPGVGLDKANGTRKVTSTYGARRKLSRTKRTDSRRVADYTSSSDVENL